MSILARYPRSVFGLVATVFAAVCLWLPRYNPTDYTKAVYLGVWTLGIPLFFLAEWYFLRIPITVPEDPRFVSYKESRELARNLWLAVASFLTLIYFGEYLKK
jgi:hypothetical protein